MNRARSPRLVRSERQLARLWFAVAVSLLICSPLAARLIEAAPACPFKSLFGLPCLSCGASRAAVALSRLDLEAALTVNPLAAVGWLGLVGGGIAAGLLSLAGVPLREPRWHLSTPGRWLLVGVLLANWSYLIRAGT